MVGRYVIIEVEVVEKSRWNSLTSHHRSIP
ncbi:hypothetical protein FHT71_005328 [Rhizobium sp. BK060]|nr:hypothetical protein [Rhizobium sp. BK060]